MARLSRMEPLRRLICSIALAAILLLQPAIALAAPTPSPGLDGILIKPSGTGYVEQAKPAPGIVEGPFDAAKYAEITAAPNASVTEQALARAGFMSGYGRTWVTPGNAHVFVEAVMVWNRGSTTGEVY